MRIFKNKWFFHWAQKEKISDDILTKTAKEVDRTIFLFAFAKGQRSNISDKEKAALKIIAKNFMAATQKQLKAMIDEGSIWEVKND